MNLLIVLKWKRRQECSLSSYSLNLSFLILKDIRKSILMFGGPGKSSAYYNNEKENLW